MDAHNTINVILHNATGKRASGRELIVSEKKTILDPEVAAALKEQWNASGRDNALILMHLTDADGGNHHYVTGWDGKDTFVCLTESGLTYVPYRKLEKMVYDSEWNSETRLIEVRAPILRESMERSDVDMLLDRIKRTLVKSGKKRRKGRLRNMEKFFSESETQAEKAAKSGPKSTTEFIKVDEKDERVPAAKPPKSESSWDLRCADGSVKRRNLTHPMMQVECGEPQLDKRKQVEVRGEGKGGGTGPTPGGNKTDPQMNARKQVDVRHESAGDPQLGKRQNVSMNSEGKGGGVGPTPGGNKTDPQMNSRELVDVRHEEKTTGCSKCGCNGENYTTYAGERGKCPECGARPEITVRTEGLGLGKSGKGLFGPGCGQKSPMGAKKPLLMFMLIKKGKGGKSPKKPMSEMVQTCAHCGAHHVSMGGRATDPFLGPFEHPEPSKDAPHVGDCPTCAAKRAREGGGLKLTLHGINPPKKNKDCMDCGESISRSPLSLVTSVTEDVNMVAKKFFKGDVEKAKLHAHKFLANIEKVRSRAKARKG